MVQIYAKYLELEGSHYEIGQKLGRIAAGIPPLKAFQTSGQLRLDAGDASLAITLFDRWCPGLNEEIHGFADVLGVDPIQVTYYAMTYLKPGCSQIALLPGITGNGHVMLARNYEFSHQMEDFTLTRTRVTGKYTHLSSSVMQFGRDEGLNECGLAVSMSSCGFPVGAPEGMRRPALRGLQFWAVIRTLLENCKDVAEALAFLEGMPIAYNINLMLADSSGRAALLETVDGHRALKQIDSEGQEQSLYATNHVVLPELKQYEPKVMRHSIQRYQIIHQFLERTGDITSADLRSFLLNQPPQGVCFHYFEDFFGTTKSMVMDLNEGKIDLCWGGLASNGWQTFSVSQPLEEKIQPVDLVMEKPPEGFFEFIQREEL